MIGRRRKLRRQASGQALIAGFLLLCLALLVPGCFTGEESNPYYGRIVVPRQQEFRWSDGGLPRVFDPAFAAAPPDTDAVRALFEGLTDYDPQTLKPVPGVATRWESSDDGRVWTFYLRDEARWSTGEQVTAGDFVRSWERTLLLGALAPHTDLLSNIVGARSYVGSAKPGIASAALPVIKSEGVARATAPQINDALHPGAKPLFGAEEVSTHVLRVRLQRANPNFPALVAHPVFRPVKVGAEGASVKLVGTQLISNGAFLLTQSESGRVSLERAENYWDKDQISLKRVEFVDTRDAESALAAYHAGEIDAVTNAPFEPLALKLLAPYKDYRRETYGALTYYSFNTSHAPFNDVRVREALAISIDRERISQDEMAGATDPANRFIPVIRSAGYSDPVVPKSAIINTDQAHARQLLAAAGYPDGVGFPVVRLLINRNDQQRQVAQAVAAMWRSALRIETEIVVKNWDEYEAAIRAGEYDLARRGSVMRSADEFSNISMLFPAEEKPAASSSTAGPPEGETARAGNQENIAVAGSTSRQEKPTGARIETEAEAIRELKAIPIYFACSYALVKPYVVGFDSNILDAPSLKSVRINTTWLPPKSNSNSNAR